MNDKQQYLVAAAAFAALGIWMFILVRCWHRHALNLASRYDIPQRRKVAAFHYVLILPFVGGPMIGTIWFVTRHTSVASLVLVLGYILALAPALIWWGSRMKELQKLGYGRQTTSSKG